MLVSMLERANGNINERNRALVGVDFIIRNAL